MDSISPSPLRAQSRSGAELTVGLKPSKTNLLSAVLSYASYYSSKQWTPLFSIHNNTTPRNKSGIIMLHISIHIQLFGLRWSHRNFGNFMPILNWNKRKTIRKKTVSTHFLFLSLSVSVHLSVRPSVRPSIHLSLSLSFCLSLSVTLSFSLSWSSSLLHIFYHIIVFSCFCKLNSSWYNIKS